MTGKGYLSTFGGDASSTGGGGGSGGRIKFYFFSWFNGSSTPGMADNLNLTLVLNGGLGGSPM